MRKKRRRCVHLYVIVTPEEQALIRERMNEAGVRNLGAYERKMVLNGYMLHVDLSDVRELVSLQRRCSNNLNQVAIQANTYSGIYPEEIKTLQRDYETLWGPLGMVRKYPDLERGESASQPGRDHIPPRVFKEMARLLKQKAKLEELLAGIGAFNAKSRAAEIAAFMDQYIPAVERMYNLMKKYQVAFTETTMENKKLKQKNTQLEQSLEKATQESTLKQLADAKLRWDYADAVAVLDRIPKEVLDVYTRSSGRKERPIEQNL